MRPSKHHRWAKKEVAILHEAVFGLEDGMVSTLGALVGIAVGTQNASVVILSGFVLIFVESLSMAAGTFLSSKTDDETEQEQLREELQEIETIPEEEVEELRTIYQEKGFTKKEAELLVKRITSNKKLWLEEMAYHELGIIPRPGAKPTFRALIMGSSYIIGGLIPILPYLLLPLEVGISISIFLTVLALFGVGAGKTRFTGRNWLRSGVEMVMVSLAAAIVGYLVSRIVTGAV